MSATRFDQAALEDLRAGLARMDAMIAQERSKFAAYGSAGRDLDSQLKAKLAQHDARRSELSLNGSDSDKRRNEMRAAADALKLSFETWMADIERAFNKTAR